jgi:hypothetical protein
MEPDLQMTVDALHFCTSKLGIMHDTKVRFATPQKE